MITTSVRDDISEFSWMIELSNRLNADVSWVTLITNFPKLFIDRVMDAVAGMDRTAIKEREGHRGSAYITSSNKRARRRIYTEFDI
jgi:hypothetical protein